MKGQFMRQEAVEALEVESETILLNQKTFTVTKLNETGGFVWQSLSESSTFEQLVERTSAEFQADQAAVAQDLESFLEQMIEVGLIRVEG